LATLQKQNVSINFSKGLNTKQDPWQLQPGEFLALNNMVFSKGGLLQKRNGYQYLSSTPTTESAAYLTTFNDNLTAIGDSVFAYNNSSKGWLTKGLYQPLGLSVLPLIRNTVNQIQCDTAVSANGLVCTVYSESNGTTVTYKYAIADSTTGQNIVAPSLIPVPSGTVTGSPRVFLLANYFILAFTNVISGTAHLQYIAISTFNPTTLTTPADLASAYIPSPGLSWDGVVVNATLYVAYDTTTGGQAVKVTSLSSAQASLGQTGATPTSFVGSKATLMSVCADTTQANVAIYLSFYDSSSSTGFTASVDVNLNLVFNPVEVISTGTVANLTSYAQNGTCTVYYEVKGSYSYDSSIPNNHVDSVTITTTGSTAVQSVFSTGASTVTADSGNPFVRLLGKSVVDNTTAANIAPGTTVIDFEGSGGVGVLSQDTAGNSASSPGDTLVFLTVSSAAVVARGIGLASKAFSVDGTTYFLAAYQSPFQPTYFLVNGTSSLDTSPVIAAKLAYENGNGYLTLGLPSVSITNGNVAQVAYLYKDLIEAQAPSGIESINLSAPQVYSQTGVNLSTFTVGTQDIDSAEIGSNLNLTGGFLWMYDGYLPVEQNFFLWPDSVEVTTSASYSVAPTGTTTTGSNVLTAMSSTSGIGLGMAVSGTGVPADQFVTAIGTTTVTFGPGVASGNNSAETITLTGNITTAQQYYYQVIYDWTDNQGNEQRSAPSIPVTITTTGSTSINTLNIPTLRLTYKTANPAKIRIYRWSTAEQVYYEVTSITQPLMNDTTVDSVTFIDGFTDNAIVGNNIIYTTGGVVEDVNGPASNIMTLFDTRLWLVDAEDPNLLWYSKQVIEGTPVEMSDLFTLYVAPNTGTSFSTGGITGLAPMDDKIIMFKKDAIYYMNGTGPDNTGSNSQYSQPIFVTSTVGCTNQQSIVLMQNGLMFQSDKGIWLLGRDLSTQYIGAAVEEFNSSVVNSAINVPAQNQIRFTLNTGQTLMYDYYYQQWGTFSDVPAVSSCIFESLHTFINQYGSVYQEQPGVYLDGSNPVLMNFTTSWFDLAGLQGYQRLNFFYILGQYYSPHKLQYSIAYDYNSSPSQSNVIQPTNFSSAVPSSYGVPSAPFGAKTNVEQWRVFAAQQRCESFQLSMQELFDPTLGTSAGFGLTISGLNLVVSVKKGFKPIRNASSIGGGTNRG
jgi:hypothetical protein